MEPPPNYEVMLCSVLNNQVRKETTVVASFDSSSSLPHRRWCLVVASGKLGAYVSSIRAGKEQGRKEGGVAGKRQRWRR